MPERIPPSTKHRRRRRIRLANRKKLRREPLRILSRSVSEPNLRTKMQLLPSCPSSLVGTGDDAAEFGNQASLLRSRCYTDGGFFSSAPMLPFPSPLRPDIMQEAKVVVSVTVEGSPGPVRAMIKLGATVDEAIGVVVDRYTREGRSPKLALDDDATSFQLHHSHFSLESLNKGDKIGEVGSRNFYLRRSCEGRDLISDSEIELLNGSRLQTLPLPPPSHVFFALVAARLSKIKRRTKRLWRVVLCITRA